MLSWIGKNSRAARVLVITVLLASAIGAVAVAANVELGGDRPDRFYSQGESKQVAPVEAISARLTKNFAVLRDQPSPPASTRVGSGSPSFVGGNAALARLALTAEDGDRIYVVPAQGGVCIQSSLGRAAGCFSEDVALKGNTASTVVCSPYLPTDKLDVAGLLPDGARNVSATMNDGTIRSVSVENNAYLLHLDRSGPLPTTIEWDDEQGHQVRDANVPGDARDTPCVHYDLSNARPDR